MTSHCSSGEVHLEARTDVAILASPGRGSIQRRLGQIETDIPSNPVQVEIAQNHAFAAADIHQADPSRVGLDLVCDHGIARGFAAAVQELPGPAFVLLFRTLLLCLTLIMMLALSLRAALIFRHPP